MLSPKAQKLIQDYLSLPFDGLTGVRCPYFINRGRRGQLRVLAGKGTPKEIVEEAKIISLQYHSGLFDHDGCCAFHRGEQVDERTKVEAVRKFLIDNNLGVDCSGLATHILRAHFLETAQVDIARKFVRNLSVSCLRKIIARLRPIESIGVKTSYCNDANTQKLGDETTGYDYSNIQPGDIVTMLETGPAHKRSHILVITDCDGQTIRYIHSRAWSAEGQYGQGVNTGEIKITARSKGLLAQEWTEKSPALTADLFHQANANETYAEAKNARVLEIRRIKIS